MKRCSFFKLLISRYIDGDCTNREIETLKNHVSQCTSCYNTLYDFILMKDLVAKSYVPDNSAVSSSLFFRRQPVTTKQHSPTSFPALRFAALVICAFTLVAAFSIINIKNSRHIPIIYTDSIISKLKNSPLGSFVYYQEFAGKGIHLQNSDSQTVSVSYVKQTQVQQFVSSYESPLFHDSEALTNRYCAVLMESAH